MASNDRAMLAGSLHGTAAENTFAGVRSFMRRSYRKVLDGVDVAVTGIPFDIATTNRPGARSGPEAIRRASAMISFGCHPEFGFDPFDRLAVIDYGDCDLPVGDLPRALAAIDAHAEAIISAGVSMVSLGGDHLSTLPLLRAHARRHGALALVHFDAHMDTTSDDGYTHGTVLHHAARENLISPRHSIQIGIRAVNAGQEFEHNRRLGFTVLSAEWVHMQGIESVVARVKEIVGDAPAYLTFDIDCIDVSMAPGTGTPEVGGLFTWQAEAILRRFSGIDFRGMDLVEVAPAYDVSEITALAAARITFTYLCLRAEGRG